MAHTRGVSDPAYFDTKAFVVSKNFHVGWISVYDAVGIIGSLAFVMLNITIVLISWLFVFGRKADMGSPLFPLKVWLFCGLTGGMIGYFTTFGNFNAAFIGMCSFAIVLVHLDRIEHRNALKVVSPSPPMPHGIPGRTEVFSPLRVPSK